MKRYVLLSFFCMLVILLHSDMYFDIGSGISFGSHEVGMISSLKQGKSFFDGKWLINAEIAYNTAEYSDGLYNLFFIAPNFIYYLIPILQLSVSPGFSFGSYSYNSNDIHYHGNVLCGSAHVVDRRISNFSSKVSIATDIGNKYGILVGLEYFNVSGKDLHYIGAFIKFRTFKSKE